jgi:hypothetical protein
LDDYIGQAVDSKLDLMLLIGGVEERTAIQLVMCTRLRKIGDEKFLREGFSAIMGSGKEMTVFSFFHHEV